MALKIGVLSQKGGVGKSTLARAIAVEFARKEFNVKIADMDLKQGTTTSWNALRQDKKIKPKIEAQLFGEVKDVLKQNDLYDLIIFDGVGQADSQTLAIAKACTVVILPSGLSRDDLAPQIKLGNEMIKKGIARQKIGFSLSRTGRSDREIQDARELIESVGYTYLGKIDEKTSITQAHDQGLSANETKYETINDAVDRVIQGIVDLIENNVNE